MPGLQSRLEIRANAFNVFNNLNLKPFEFNTPSTQIESPDFGQADKAWRAGWWNSRLGSASRGAETPNDVGKWEHREVTARVVRLAPCG